MNIPKSYEDLAADLASEKIISKTLLGQKEAYMMLADKGRLDLSESKAREAALREELEALRESYEAMRDRKNSIVDLQQRLTVAEQALKFYADGDHLLMADADAWDICSGEPVNRLTYSQGDRRYVNGWNDACSHWEYQSAPVAVVHTMKSIMEAVEASRCYIVLTSDQCYALAQSLNGVNK